MWTRRTLSDPSRSAMVRASLSVRVQTRAVRPPASAARESRARAGAPRSTIFSSQSRDHAHDRKRDRQVVVAHFDGFLIPIHRDAATRRCGDAATRAALLCAAHRKERRTALIHSTVSSVPEGTRARSLTERHHAAEDGLLSQPLLRDARGHARCRTKGPYTGRARSDPRGPSHRLAPEGQVCLHVFGWAEGLALSAGGAALHALRASPPG